MKDLRWTKLHSEYLVKKNWATLRVDTCRLPDGRIMDDYYVLEYPNWANAIAITEDGDVLLVKQYRHAAGEVVLEIPGGVVDAGESPEEAVKRELLEETGYAFTEIEKLCELWPNPATGNNRIHSYLAKGGKLVAGQSLDEHEELIVEKVSIARLKQLLLDNQIGQAMHVSGIFYALLKLGEIK